MSKNYRNARKLIIGEGLKPVEHDHSGRSHLRIRCRRSDGSEKLFLFPATPSDQRWVKNSRSELRRWAKEAS